METDKDSLFAYAEKMFNRGDSYSAIIHYLDRKGADPEVKREILKALKKPKTQENPQIHRFIIVGIVIAIVAAICYSVKMPLQYSILCIFLIFMTMLRIANHIRIVWKKFK